MPTADKPQHLFADMLDRVLRRVRSLLGPDADLSRVVVEPPRDPTHGDMATNAAMVLAKDAGKEAARTGRGHRREAARRRDGRQGRRRGPGFINLTLKPHVWAEELRVVLAAGKDYGRSDIGNGEKVNVEYVSANPTGPMHVGHGRGAVFGDALANLLGLRRLRRDARILHQRCRRAGRRAGALGVLALSRGARRGHRRIPEGLYPGDYLKPVGGELAAEHGPKLSAMRESEWLPIVRAKAIAMMMDMIRDDLAALNVRHDVFFSERSLIEGGKDQVGATIEIIARKRRSL